MFTNDFKLTVFDELLNINEIIKIFTDYQFISKKYIYLIFMLFLDRIIKFFYSPKITVNCVSFGVARSAFVTSQQHQIGANKNTAFLFLCFSF
jgi:hypothetical protein